MHKIIVVVISGPTEIGHTADIKNSYLCALFSETVFTYLTAHFAVVSKRNVHWVVLKHRFNTWTLARLYYFHIGTYCCVFIKLLQERIAAVQNSNIQGPLKWMLYRVGNMPNTNTTLNLPDSVDKCKTDIKTFLLMQPYHLNFLICRFELFCTLRLSSTSRSLYSVSYRTNLPSMKPHRYEAGYMRC